MKTGRLLDVLSGHEGPVHGLMFSPTNVSSLPLVHLCADASKLILIVLKLGLHEYYLPVTFPSLIFVWEDVCNPSILDVFGLFKSLGLVQSMLPKVYNKCSVFDSIGCLRRRLFSHVGNLSFFFMGQNCSIVGCF